MRNGRVVLDEPVRGDTSRGYRDDILGSRHAGSRAAQNVLQRRLVPRDIHGRVVDGPKDAGHAVLAEDNVGVERVGRIGREGGRTGCRARDNGSEKGGRRVGTAWVGRRRASSSWCRLGRSRAHVRDDGGRTWVVAQATGSHGHGNVEPVKARGGGGIDDDIVALADGDVQTRHGLGLHGHKVGSHNCERVADERDSIGVLDRGVDDAQQMSFTGREGNGLVAAATALGIDVFAVEQNIVTRRCGSWESRDEGVVRIVNTGQCGVDGRIVPVRDEQRAEINVIVGRRRSIDDNGTEHAVAILGREV